jgi:type I restriction-modification system DNA methylase subunit
MARAKKVNNKSSGPNPGFEATLWAAEQASEPAILGKPRNETYMNNGTLTLSQLESYLWEAANILRGPVDAADFKTYVFPLLFFKRISDVHDEEYLVALAESDGDEEYARFPQNYRFQVPENHHWSDVRAVTTNVGQALQTAMRGIETANPETLYGIFGDAQWTNKDRLSDSLLRDLIEHFSRINMGNEAAQADILRPPAGYGQANPQRDRLCGFQWSSLPDLF